MLQIIEWQETFENAKSRDIDHCTWIPVPNKQGRNYRRLLKMPSGAMHYGVFIALVLVCSRQENPRDGWLTTDGTGEGQPLSLADLCNLTFIPVHILKRSIEVLSTEIGWLRDTTVSSGDTLSSQGMRIKNRTEQKEQNRKKEGRAAPFAPPAIYQVGKYASSIGFSIDAEQFVNFYQSKGWLVGKNKMKDWKAAVRTWKRRESNEQKPKQPVGHYRESEKLA